MDFLSAAALPWLGDAQGRLRDAWAARRLPHSLLLLAAAGLGAEQLAAWTAALALCDSEAPRPCGTCPSCVLLRADTHPDFNVVRLGEDASQIKVDQIRDLIDSLVLASYRGGYKVAIVEAAEALNVNAANAFLKTLEEPTDKTLLILVAKPNHRLPATITSRCLKMHIRIPDKQVAVGWLESHRPGGSPWDAALALAGGAPLAALELEAAALAALEEEMQAGVRQLAGGSVDISVLAERWAKSDAALRLTWLENWITHRVRAYLGAAASIQSAEPVRLSGALLKSKMQSLFELLDAARELRRLASTGLNQQLALEALLLDARAALAK